MDPLHLRSSGTSLLLAFHTGEAQIVHWGADLGEALPDLALLAAPVPHSALDTPVVGGLLPQASSGWLGRPGLRGQRSESGVPGFAFSPPCGWCPQSTTAGTPPSCSRPIRRRASKSAPPSR